MQENLKTSTPNGLAHESVCSVQVILFQVSPSAGGGGKGYSVISVLMVRMKSNFPIQKKKTIYLSVKNNKRTQHQKRVFAKIILATKTSPPELSNPSSSSLSSSSSSSSSLQDTVVLSRSLREGRGQDIFCIHAVSQKEYGRGYCG